MDSRLRWNFDWSSWFWTKVKSGLRLPLLDYLIVNGLGRWYHPPNSSISNRNHLLILETRMSRLGKPKYRNTCALCYYLSVSSDDTMDTRKTCSCSPWERFNAWGCSHDVLRFVEMFDTRGRHDYQSVRWFGMKQALTCSHFSFWYSLTCDVVAFVYEIMLAAWKIGLIIGLTRAIGFGIQFWIHWCCSPLLPL